jgi:hypothetical protein
MHHAARHASRTRSKHAGKARGRACGRRSTLATAPTEAAHLSRRLHSRSSCCAPKWSTTCQLLLPQRSCAKPAAEHDEHGHHGARDVATDGCAAHLRRVCTQPKALSRSDAMAARAVGACWHGLCSSQSTRSSLRADCSAGRQWARPGRRQARRRSGTGGQGSRQGSWAHHPTYLRRSARSNGAVRDDRDVCTQSKYSVLSLSTRT